MNIFEQNISALKSTNTKLYNQIKQIQTNSTFEVFMTDNPANANVLNTTNNTPLYIEEPLTYIENKIEEFKTYNKHKSLYFFGIGNGYLFKKLLENDIHKDVYIFEPEIELIYIALNLVDLSDAIKKERLHIHLTSDVNFIYMLHTLNEQDKLYFKAYNLHLHSAYYEQYQEEILSVNQSILQVFKNHVNIIGNDCN